MTATVESAPAWFGGPDHRCDVIFLKHPLTADDAFDALPAPREGVDHWGKGPAGCLYASRVTAQATKSRLGQIAASPIYPAITDPELEHHHETAVAPRRTDFIALAQVAHLSFAGRHTEAFR